MTNERRAPGEGTLEWLPKTKRFRVRITVDTPTGKTRKAFTHPTKKGVVAKRDAWLRDRQGLAFDAEKLTVSEYLDTKRGVLHVRRTLHREKGSRIRYGPPRAARNAR